MQSTSFHLSPQAFWRWGQVCLVGGLTLGLLLIPYLVWKSATLLYIFPVVLLGGVAAWYLFRHPLLNLAFVLGGFVLITDFQEGLQIQEVFYGAYYAAFLAHWFILRLYVYRERVFQQAEDWLLLLFLVWITASVGGTILHGGSLSEAVNELFSLSMLALYFPIKEACIRYRRAPMVILGVLLFLGFFIATRNLLQFQEKLQSAEAMWQIVRGRVHTNETFLVVPGLCVLVLMLYSLRHSHRLVLFGAFVLFFVTLIITQSRAYWINLAFGTLILFLLMDRRHKTRLVWLGLACGVGVVAMGLMLFGKTLVLIGLGILERFVSISSATSKDISLINRFYESRAVLELIARNPILGYGPGVSYQVFDIIDKMTFTKAFVHNGFLMIWFKYGLIGLVLLVTFWARTIWLGLQTFRRTEALKLWRLYGLIACISLCAAIPSATTSVPFYRSDTSIAFAILAGWAAGLHRRVQRDVAYVPSARP